MTTKILIIHTLIQQNKFEIRQGRVYIYAYIGSGLECICLIIMIDDRTNKQDAMRNMQVHRYNIRCDSKTVIDRLYILQIGTLCVYAVYIIQYNFLGPRHSDVFQLFPYFSPKVQKFQLLSFAIKRRHAQTLKTVSISVCIYQI